MRFLKSLKVLAFVVLALGMIVAAEMSQAVAESFLAGDESQMATLVNGHRSSHGMSSLQTNEALRMVARRQAQRMVMAGYIYHNPDLGEEARQAIPGWLLLGENVGVGPDAPAVEQAFLDSPNHHHNIDTGEFNIVGMGAMAADDGQRYYTQNFAHWNGSSTGGATASRPASKTAPAPIARAKPPAVAAPVRRPAVASRPATTPVATAAPTPAPTPFPTPDEPAGPAAKPARTVDLGTGLVAMLTRFLAKLAFWR
jgi:hypothetical protein